MSRQVFLLGVGMVLVALAFLLTDALLSPPGVTEARLRRIRPGMTERQVEGLLGRRRTYVYLEFERAREGREGRWERGHGTAYVTFGRDGLVKRTRFTPRGARALNRRVARGWQRFLDWLRR